MNKKATAQPAKNLPAATTQKNAVVKKTDPMAMMVADVSSGSTGFETMNADDLAIPFISILQALSPQLRGATKIKGAVEGMFINTVNNELYDGSEGIRLIPCAYQKAWVEWVPRDAGGGFVRQYLTDDILNECTKDDKGRDTLQSGNHIVTTAYHFCLLMKEDGSFERVVVSLTSTQLKKSRRWNSLQQSLTIDLPNGRKIPAPMWSHIYTATSAEESKDTYTWSGWEIGSPVLIDDGDLYMAAKKFHDDVVGGMVKTVTPPEAEAPVSVDATNDPEPEHF